MIDSVRGWANTDVVFACHGTVEAGKGAVTRYPRLKIIALLAVVVLIAASTAANAAGYFVDDFNDANDDGWTQTEGA